MPRLQDGPPDQRAEKLEETKNDPLTEWLARHQESGDIEHMNTIDGITYYRMLKPLVLE